MHTVIGILQGLMAFVFMFSGINKSYFDEKTLVQKGQTGVEGPSQMAHKVHWDFRDTRGDRIDIANGNQ